MSVLALAGGVGGAKLANGLAAILPPGTLTVAVNTGDDFEHMGLLICPDLDSVTYALAGMNNTELGWGVAGESWTFMDATARLGGETWFRLGDRDLATHILRRQLFQQGSLSTATDDIRRRLGIVQRIVPMSDDPVRSIVSTDRGDLSFQDYFVRYKCVPRFLSIHFEGAETAKPSAGLLAALDDPALEAIILCPSNPLLSIAPILAIPGIRERLAGRTVPCVALSPFISGQAVKGPAAKIMAELGIAPTPSAVAAHYDGLIDGLVIDTADAAAIPGERPALFATDILMRDPADQQRLGGEVLDFARSLT
ncbi:2-phospho-L-lactate transferase [Sphingobium cloacae]|uniref:2-phospho-L-lactate transferase n=1 Tax=Sphingobium cloacae TaxID=120107 RepID=A0A1E1EZJ9_9SPHN|nr:2-phospho-L-lactate transferase [Sphingobium cloacae]BAV63680.1 2-phospho-L-lactate transferase [Sphingobium cloacae]